MHTLKIIICCLLVFTTSIIPVYADHGTFIDIAMLTGEESFDRSKDIPVSFLVKNSNVECLLLYNITVAFDEPDAGLLPEGARTNFTLPGTFEMPPKSTETFTVNMSLHPETIPKLYTIKVLLTARSCDDEAHIPDNVDGPRVGLQVPPAQSQCIIATATYGSELAPEVQFLRNFRDNTVLSTYSGSNFMTLFNRFYYSWSPDVADTIRDNDGLKSMSRAVIAPLLGILKVGSMAGENESGILVSGIVSSMLIGAVYVTPLSTGSLIALKRNVKKHHVKYALITWLAAVVLVGGASILHSDMFMMVSAGMLVLSSIALSAIGLTFAIKRLWSGASHPSHLSARPHE